MSDDKYKQFDAIIKLADFRRQYRDARRTLAWRINLATWVLLAALIATCDKYPKWLSVAGVAFALIAHFLWIRWNFIAGERDAHRMWKHYDEARKIISVDEPAPPKKLASLFHHYPTAGTFFVTLALSIAALTIIFK